MELLAEIWQTARRNKLRTSLTGFAVAWGIFMLIVLLGAGAGLINAQRENQGEWVDNSMMVFGGMTSKEYEGLKEGRDISLNQRDIAITRTSFPEHIDQVGAIIYESSNTISYGQNYVLSNLRGVYPAYATIQKVKLKAGRFINDIDLREQRKVMLIGERQAKELIKGEASNLIGKNVKIGNIAFTVVGITRDNENEMSNDVITPFTTLRTIYNHGDNTDRIIFTFHGLTTEEQNEAFEADYRKALNRNHRAAPDDEDAVWLWNRFTQAMQMENGTAIIETALWIIGLFTLLSGIVGVSNIMLITVRERTHEFGIRKAIGATPLSLLRIIIVESVLVTGFFGYIGMLLGILTNFYMDYALGSKPIDTGLFQATVFVNPTVSIGTCVGVTVVLVIAGTIAGLIPAVKAARIRPIEALRAE
ncbi:MAG: ABC transporter permease [Bacteroidaceae bacterium]|nr:ABC transporter permease [Bacteroidaceae bacterium]